MPRTEARVFTSIWKDPHFTGIDPGAQWMYLFLLSQDDLAYSGVMPLRERRWAAKAAGLTVADIESALKVLEASPRRFIITDEATGELFVRSLLRRDGIWKQPNLLKQARESAEQIESPQIRAALAAELERLPLDETPSEQVKTLVAAFVEDLKEGSPYPSAYPPGEPDPNSSDDPTADPSGDPTAKDHACARGLGESNGSSGEISPLPLGPISPLPRSERKLGTRLPDDFTLTPDMRSWSASNTPHVHQDREFERFCDYWRAKPGKDGRKLDWIATWRNWMRTAEDRQGPRDRPGRGQQSTDQQFDRAMQRAQSREGTLDAQ